MKLKRIIAGFLAVTLLILTFSGCAKAPEPDHEEAPEPVIEGPGLDDLVETDSLVIYIMKEFESIQRRQIDRFSALYGVDVEIVCVALNEYQERVINDLASGSGPDVLFLYQLYGLDVIKAAMNGDFLDLTDILAEDPEFSKDDYLDGVFEACQVNERQYTVSYSCTLPVLISSKEKLEELGFAWDGIDTVADFLEEIAQLTPIDEENSNFMQMLYSKNNFYYLLTASGVSLINYETGEILPDADGLRAFLEGYKAYFPYDYDESGMTYGTNSGYRALVAGSCAFWPPADLGGIVTTIDAMEEKSCNYVIELLPGEKKEIVSNIRAGLIAINANTKNSLNAYHFVKFLLSETIQKDDVARLSNFPVHKEAIRESVYEAPSVKIVGNYDVLDYDEPALSEEEAEKLIDTLTGIDRFVLGLPVMSTMVQESMLPFFRDEKSYEECFDDLKNKLTLYLSE